MFKCYMHQIERDCPQNLGKETFNTILLDNQDGEME
jgi:hypothetical protein